MEQWYTQTASEVLKNIGSDANNGLAEGEAQKRLQSYGKNSLAVKRKKSIFKKIIEQLSDFMILLLIAAAIISFFVSLHEGEGSYTDTILILAIVFLNALMGIIQETKAEHAIEALQKMSAPKTTVIREGKTKEIESSIIVPGDVVCFETGDRITADCRILEESSLRSEESSLTGESVPVTKSAFAAVSAASPIGERSNMLFSGCSVAAGRCKAVVVETGMQTEVGKIADLISISEPPDTPLQKRLAGIGKVLGIVAIAICAVIFFLGLSGGSSALDCFMLSVSLAVAAVPEGLPAIVTIVLALGVQRLARKNAIVRKLPAVETLGSATVICSDKTGTLTQNKMTVTKTYNLEDNEKLEKKMLQYGALCTNCQGEGEAIIGEPTENAIVIAAEKKGMKKSDLERQYVRISEISFDSTRKMMTTIHKKSEGGYLVITKGAPDVLLPLCTSGEGGTVEPMSKTLREKVLQNNTQMAQEALRVLAVAYKNVDALPRNGKIEQDLTFLGLVGMIDPPRPEVKDAVKTCKRAGIRPVMITGDHAATAAAIAKELGIMTGSSLTITGTQLETMTDAQLQKDINKYCVFARVSPEHKTRIVKAFQANGEIVAMTGDGVNDAPALKSADIGCAMGKSGTDVARDAADIVLSDDNFGTIVSAVKEGRGIYQNIRKTVHFLLSCNIGEILIILGSLLIGHQAPLIPIQLLWINLVTDSLPALALGAEKTDGDIMEQKPVNPRSSMFSGGKGLDIIVQGFMIGALALFAYSIGAKIGGHKTGSTFAFAVLGLSQLVHAFNIRSDRPLLKIGPFSNKYMTAAFVICVAMQVAVICVPALAAIFGATVLTLAQWRIVIVLSLTPFVAVEASKLIMQKVRDTY